MSDAPMTEPLKRIAQYFEEFRRCVEDCRSADPFRPEQWKNAFAALARLRDRYNVEKASPTSEQRAALDKALEDDIFIKGMMNARQVGEHVTQRNQPTILVTASDELREFDDAGPSNIGGIGSFSEFGGHCIEAQFKSGVLRHQSIDSSPLHGVDLTDGIDESLKLSAHLSTQPRNLGGDERRDLYTATFALGLLALTFALVGPLSPPFD